MIGELWRMWVKIWWFEKWPFIDIIWRLVIRIRKVVWIYNREFLIYRSRCFIFEFINISINLSIEYLFILFHYCYKFSDVGDAHFVKAVFISWQFGWNLCDMEWQGLDLFFGNAQFLYTFFIGWEFGWNICELFLLLACLGTCISKFWKHSRDVVV